jgi:tellurite resistance protein TehA-like permease
MDSCISVFFVAKHYGSTPIAVIVLAIVALIAFIVTILNLPEIYYIVTSKQIPPEVTAPIDVTMILMLGLVIAGLYFLSKRGEK